MISTSDRAAALTKITTIPVDFYPSDVVVNPTTNRLYVANTDPVSAAANKVRVIDTTSNGIVTTISVPSVVFL